ncbi:MAG: hypothetical protein NVS2B12_04510 [Ktedonobacteraceae bacterium]
MLINTGSLIATTGVTSILGFAYWWLAARQFPPVAVGIASTSTSAMMLIGGLCTIGFSTLLITELPRKPELAGPLISTAMVAIGIVSTVTSVVFALVAPYLSMEYRPLSASILDITIFTIGIAQSAMTLVLDQAMVGLLRGELQLWRNIVFSVVKLLGLFVVGITMSRTDGMSIYAAWAFAGIFSMLLLLAYAQWKGYLAKRDFWPRLSMMKNLGLPALQHHVLNTMVQAPMQVLPLMVTALISATVTAWFYTAWMIANFLFLIPSALTTVLHAMNAADTAALARKARSTMALAFLISILIEVIVLFATDLILLPFGSNYALQASGCLRVLSLAAFPFIIKTHYISICRIQDRIAPAMRSLIPGSVIELVGATIGAHFGGLLGLSAGWVIALFLESLFMLPTVYQALWPKTLPAFAALSARAEIDFEDVWLGDTARLPITSLGFVGQGNEGAEAIWQMDTTIMPAIKKFRQDTQTALAAIKKDGPATEGAERKLQPATTKDVEARAVEVVPTRPTLERLPLETARPVLKRSHLQHYQSDDKQDAGELDFSTRLQATDRQTPPEGMQREEINKVIVKD